MIESVSSDENFSLYKNNPEFRKRLKKVFDGINNIKHNLKPTTNDDEPTENENNLMTCEPIPLSTDAIFKKPVGKPPRTNFTNRKAPDYLVNPHKWKRYSLDVSKEDMSEKANSLAAMSFLKELEDRKSQNEKAPHSHDSSMSQKIVFKKVSPQQRTNIREMEKVKFRDSKVIMPEYVVGQKVKKDLQKKAKKLRDVGVIKEVKLNHLTESTDDL